MSLQNINHCTPNIILLYAFNTIDKIHYKLKSVAQLKYYTFIHLRNKDKNKINVLLVKHNVNKRYFYVGTYYYNYILTCSPMGSK